MWFEWWSHEKGWGRELGPEVCESVLTGGYVTFKAECLTAFGHKWSALGWPPQKVGRGRI